MNDARIPVTVLTGFLGAGKTTLLNRILTEHHGQRIAVIENEFGEVGVDQALVVDADEEIFEMNNGCICCTVRGDLIRILANLRKRRDRFDRVVVETTGLANPAPVAQTFFVDDDVRADYRLDAIVTLVDAAHVALHLDDSPEAIEQIAFADVIVLNKVDLAPESQVAAVEARVRSINAVASLRRAKMAEVPIAHVLDVGGFDLDRALENRPAFLEPERPFEWGGVFHLSDDATLVLAAGPDRSMAIALAPAREDTDLAALADAAERMFAGPRRKVAPGERVIVADGPQMLTLDPKGTRFAFDVPAGRYALFTEHGGAEYDVHVELGGQRRDAQVSHAWSAQHQHDNSVTSVALVMDRPFDETKLNRWLGKLLRERGADIFRMKGILDVAGQDQRYVFQGVHMLLDGRPDRTWAPGPRKSELVFIGRNLDRAALEAELRRCVA